MKHKLRFSLRTMLILIAVICLYLSFWPATIARGVRDIHMLFDRRYCDAKAVLPLLLTTKELTTSAYGQNGTPYVRTHYLVWFYGWTAELPFTTLRQLIRGESPPSGVYKPDEKDRISNEATSA
jgi:hypothetical protein